MSRSFTLQQLQEVRAAITKVRNGVQSYTVDGQTFNYPSLADLQKEEQKLLGRLRTRVSSHNIGGIFS